MLAQTRSSAASAVALVALLTLMAGGPGLVGPVALPHASAQQVTVEPFEPAAAVCWIDLGRTGSFTDDAFYLHVTDVDGSGSTADDTSLSTYDIRLSQRGEHEPGTLVMDGDTVETTASATCRPLKLDTWDADGNGGFNEGDWLYIGADAGDDRYGPASGADASAVRWIRLTPTEGGQPGTLVLQGDQDTIGRQGTGSFPGEPAFFDADNSRDLTPGDRAYVIPRDIEDRSPLPIHSIRLSAGSTGSQPGEDQGAAGEQEPADGDKGQAEAEPNASQAATTDPEARRLAQDALEAAQEAYQAAREAQGAAEEAKQAALGARETIEANSQQLDTILDRQAAANQENAEPWPSGLSLLVLFATLALLAHQWKRYRGD